MQTKPPWQQPSEDHQWLSLWAKCPTFSLPLLQKDLSFIVKKGALPCLIPEIAVPVGVFCLFLFKDSNLPHEDSFSVLFSHL